jgi:hypothetical protein
MHMRSHAGRCMIALRMLGRRIARSSCHRHPILIGGHVPPLLGFLCCTPHDLMTGFANSRVTFPDSGISSPEPSVPHPRNVQSSSHPRLPPPRSLRPERVSSCGNPARPDPARVHAAHGDNGQLQGCGPARTGSSEQSPARRGQENPGKHRLPHAASQRPGPPKPGHGLVIGFLQQFRSFIFAGPCFRQLYCHDLR